MVDVRIRVDEPQVGRVIDRLNALRADASDMTPAMAAVAGYLRSRTHHHFEDESAPDGTPWRPLTAATRLQRERLGFTGPILQRRVRPGLLGSIQSTFTRDAAAVGTNLVHAATHQFGRDQGRGRIPARPFLGLAPGDGEAILDIVRRHLVGA